MGLFTQRFFWSVYGLLLCISLLTIYSIEPRRIGGHLMHIAIGFVIVMVVKQVRLRIVVGMIKKLNRWILFIAIGFLIYALFTNITIGGAIARRWVNIAGINFQPSSLFALASIFVIACRTYQMQIEKKNTSRFADFYLFALPMLGGFGMILISDLSTSMVLLLTLAFMMVLIRYPIRNLLRFLPSMLVIALIGAIVVGVLYKTDKIPPSVDKKIETWHNRLTYHLMDPEEVRRLPRSEQREVRENNRQQETAKLAIQNGGFFSFRPGQSAQKNFIGNASNDFIYPIIIEEYGVFLGGIVLMALYMYILMYGYRYSHLTRDPLSKFVLVGMLVYLFLQVFVHFCVTLSILPNTGINLPFISRGGTSFIINSICIGFLLNVARSVDHRIAKQRKLEGESVENHHVVV